jgi:hypothetical protein
MVSGWVAALISSFYRTCLIDCSPSDACDTIEHDGGINTDHAERVATNDHLTETGAHAESGEESDTENKPQRLGLSLTKA